MRSSGDKVNSKCGSFSSSCGGYFGTENETDWKGKYSGLGTPVAREIIPGCRMRGIMERVTDCLGVFSFFADYFVGGNGKTDWLAKLRGCAEERIVVHALIGTVTTR